MRSQLTRDMLERESEAVVMFGQERHVGLTNCSDSIDADRIDKSTRNNRHIPTSDSRQRQLLSWVQQEREARQWMQQREEEYEEGISPR